MSKRRKQKRYLLFHKPSWGLRDELPNVSSLEEEYFRNKYRDQVKLEPIDDAIDSSNKPSHNEGLCENNVKVEDVAAHKCIWCGISYAMEEDLSKHLMLCLKKPVNKFLSTSVRKTMHQCNVCEKEFENKCDFTRHLLMHTGEKPHSCTTCGKGFTRPSNLTKHMLTHTKEKRHKCETCGRRFALKSHLTSHMRTHTGAKPFKCELCGEYFAHSNNFRRHMNEHEGVYKHKCGECEYRTNDSRDMKSHSYTHTGERPFKCSVCGQRFTRNSHLTRHAKRVHTTDLGDVTERL